MRALHIIMPMAGEGSRFLKEGWTIPKPLIRLHGKELFLRALDSVAGIGVPIKHSFIVRQVHIDKHEIDKKIKEVLPEANIFSVQKTTRGAVETCLVAENSIASDDGVLIMDCDLEFKSLAYIDGIREMLKRPQKEAFGGMLVSFESTNPKYSYAELGDGDCVIRTAEKEVISTHALCGAYFFSSGKTFLKIAHQLLDEPPLANREYYVSLLFNYLLRSGETVKLATMEDYRSYGTPEELKRYL